MSDIRRLNPHVSIDAALDNPALLGAALGDPTSWASWRTILKAAHGIRLHGKELKTFTAVAQRPPPKVPVKELFVIAGRGGGKSRMAAAAAVHAATCVDYKGRLAPGERGLVLVLALSMEQARSVLDYCVGFLEASPVLSQRIEQVTSTEIRLKGNIVIAVHSNSFRSIRGPTLVGCVFDESSFWRDEASANPDLEVYRAVMPALQRKASGMLIAISSPYRKSGLMYNKFKSAFGQDDKRVLVVRAASALLNPTVDQAAIDAALLDDPESARSEWLAEFRSDLSGYLDDKSIDDAIDNSRPLELPPKSGVRYHTFVDMSGGRSDFSTCCVCHVEGERIIIDAIRGRAGDPAAIWPRNTVAIQSKATATVPIWSLAHIGCSARNLATRYRGAAISTLRFCHSGPAGRSGCRIIPRRFASCACLSAKSAAPGWKPSTTLVVSTMIMRTHYAVQSFLLPARS
jgi:hypothetical protein